MAIKLGKPVEAQLILGLSKYLSSVEIYGAEVFSWKPRHVFEDFANSILEDSVQDKLSRLCGDGGISDYVDGWLNRRLLDVDTDDFTNLSDIKGFQDSTAIAERIVSDLARMPEKHVYICRLPTCIWKDKLFGTNSINLGGGLSLEVYKNLSETLIYTSGNEKKIYR